MYNHFEELEISYGMSNLHVDNMKLDGFMNDSVSKTDDFVYL